MRAIFMTFALVASFLIASVGASAAPTLAASPVCGGPDWGIGTRGFSLSGSGFPANTGLGVRVLHSDGSIFFHSGVSTGSSGSFSTYPGIFGTGSATGPLTVLALDRSSLDPAAIELARTSFTPCAGISVTATPVCAPGSTRDFTLSGSGFPVNTFLGIRVLHADGSIFYHSGVTSDASGAFGGPGLYGTGSATEPLTVLVLDRSSLDPAAIELARTSVTPCPVPIAEQLGTLEALVSGFGLPSGTEQSLAAKVEAAQQAVADGNTVAACNQLDALIAHARAQSGKKLTVAQADAIIVAAQKLRTDLGCS